MKRKVATLTLISLILISTASALALSSVAVASGIGVCAIDAVAGDGCFGFGGDGEIDGATPDEVKNSIYGNGVFREDQRQRMVTQVSSYANQSYGVSMGQAKMYGIEAHNNGSAKSVAYNKIQSEVNDFYATYQLSLIRDRNTEALKFNESLNTIQATNELSTEDVFRVKASSDSHSGNVHNAEIVEESVTLVNGSEIKSYQVNVSFTDGYTDSEIVEEVYTELGKFKSDLSDPEAVIGKDSDGDTARFLDNSDYSEAWNEINGHRQRAIDNVNNVIDKVYSQYDPGEIDLKDTMTPLELLQTASTNYEDTGYYGYASLSLEYMGLSSNESYAFNVTWNNQGVDEKTGHGQLFVNKDDFSNGLEVDTTYDASNRPAWFVHSNDNGKAQTTRLNGTFTINEMTDTETGETVNSTGVQSTKLVTTNTTKLEEQLSELREDMKDLQGGGITPVVDGFTDWVSGVFGSLKKGIGALVIVLAGLAALSSGVGRNSGGGDN
ncbi:MAG: hypothetical protein H8Z69_03890 [Nanohaloarchaea archaeon]|nr:hypothetical protein [Candidatus Nanohaloarchaea archaeon]